jgi:CspA family cold shock protein
MPQTGRVLQFDETRGYGFIAPDEGGPDVFVHANELHDDESLVMSGTRVEFEVMDGERGKKAYAVRVVEDGDKSAPASTPAPARQAPPDDDDGMCDVLAGDELRDELTELFLQNVPELTGAQIVQLRRDVLHLAKKHGWVEE